MRIHKSALILAIIATILLTIFVFYSINTVITSYRAELKEKRIERRDKKESLFDHFQKKLKVMS